MAPQTMLQRGPPNAALKQLERLVALLIGKAIDQQRHAQIVEYFDAGHVNTAGHGVADIKRKEVEVVVDVKGIAIELRIAADFEVLARVQHRPGRSGKADAAHIKVCDARSLLGEDPLDP